MEIDRIYELGSQVRVANQNKANAIRTFRGKDQVDYSLKRGIGMADILSKPWKVRQNMLETMERYLTGAIENVTSLESYIMYERGQQKQERFETIREQFDAKVAENKVTYDANSSKLVVEEPEIEGKSR